MIISVDHHVGLPFLEGLCSDLRSQIQQRVEVAAPVKRPSLKSIKFDPEWWQNATTKIVASACAFAQFFARVH